MSSLTFFSCFLVLFAYFVFFLFPFCSIFTKISPVEVENTILRPASPPTFEAATRNPRSESVAKAALVVGSNSGAALLAEQGIDALMIGSDTEVRRVDSTRRACGPGQLVESSMSVASSERELMPSLA